MSGKADDKARVIALTPKRVAAKPTLAPTVFQSDDFLRKRYDLVRRIGKGGMSVVYLARDRQLDRPVAVKVMKPFTDEEAEQNTIRFTNEARLLAKMNHRNIVHVYDFAASESGLRIIMEYVEGKTLYQQVQEGPMSELQVAAVACEVLDALEVIHDQGVIHRDIKPGNVMIDERGQVKVMDFGIAHLDELETDESSDSVVGTRKFMAPEQSRGDPVSPRTDLFSLGATMAFCLLGELPSILSPKQLPERLRGVLVQAMAHDPAQRFAGAAEMREAIEEAIRSQPAAPPKTRRVWPRLLLLGALIGVLISALLFLPELLRGGGGQVAPPPPPPDPVEDRLENREAIVIEDEAPIGVAEDEILIEDGAIIEDGGAAADAGENEASEDALEAAAEPAPPQVRELPRERPTPQPTSPSPTVQIVSGDPEIHHRPVRDVYYGDNAKFEVEVEGGGAWDVTLKFRAVDGGRWRDQNLRHRGGGLYTTTLRASGALGDGFEYYLTIVESDGNRVYARGSANDPYAVVVD